MTSWNILERTTVPASNTELTLSQRDGDFAIRITGQQGDLMNTRMHHSEDKLAEFGCARLKAVDDARVTLR